MHKNAIKIVGEVKFKKKKYLKMWDFLTKKCGIFGIEGGTKLWDFHYRGGDFRPLTSGHTGSNCVRQKRQAWLLVVGCVGCGKTLPAPRQLIDLKYKQQMKHLKR